MCLERFDYKYKSLKDRKQKPTVITVQGLGMFFSDTVPYFFHFGAEHAMVDLRSENFSTP